MDTATLKAPRRIADLEVGDSAWLRFAREGDLMLATVTAIIDADHVEFSGMLDDDTHLEFVTYRYNKRWVYGTSADRLIFIGYVPGEALPGDDPGPF
jgi:hypothetical protein